MSKKILLVCDTFLPDKTSGAKLLYDLSNKLSKTNEVLVVVPRNSNFFEIFCKSKINIKKKITTLFVPTFQLKIKFSLYEEYQNFNELYFMVQIKKNNKKFKPTSIICYSPSIFLGIFVKKLKLILT